MTETTEGRLRIVKLDVDAVIPVRGTPFSAGLDLSSIVSGVVPAKGQTLVSTGLSIRVPSGTYGRIAPRSGLAAKHGIDVGAGVIDEDYTGEIKVILFNHSAKDFAFEKGDRIAQFIVERIAYPEIVVEETIVDEKIEGGGRGAGGFGSTGMGGAPP